MGAARGMMLQLSRLRTAIRSKGILAGVSWSEQQRGGMGISAYIPLDEQRVKQEDADRLRLGEGRAIHVPELEL
jgi:hypothetical protein